MSLIYANQLSDGQLKEIYQSFLCEDDKIVLLDISRYDDDGFRWTDCQLLGDGVFSNTKPVDCPLKKEED